MYKDHKIIAVIPARKASKRLPRKNIRDFCGKPLITWSIEAAIKSKFIDLIIVSSDDPEVHRISKKHNVLSINRPEDLASDNAKSKDVLMHALDNIDFEYEVFVLLQPTSPLRDEYYIDRAITELFQKKADSVVSVSKCEHNPLWSNTLPSDNSMKNFIKEDLCDSRSQDLKEYFRLNGAIYAVKKSFFKLNNKFIGDNTFASVMPIEKSIDIDTLNDFICAEAMMNYNFLQKQPE
jgi:CMP-N,N'-diacetyllegionaminic acid synthase